MSMPAPQSRSRPLYLSGRLLHRFTTLILISFTSILTIESVNKAQGADLSSVPNIVLILADDLGYGDIGCYGNRKTQTPHLDSLAKGGLRFLDYHSSGAVCSPTRAGLMTGRYQQRCGIGMVITAKNHRHIGLKTSEVTFAERLKGAGYATAVFGKWHLGYQTKFNPVHHGFDRFRGYVSGNVDYFSHVDQTGIADWWDGERQIIEQGYVTHLITRHAVDFIEAHKTGPFCLYIAHEAPHYPYQGPGDKPERIAGGKFNTQGRRTDVAAAYREMVEELDKGIGQIVEATRRLGIAEKTLIFFCSDNGANARGNNAALRGFKGSVWEGGHRVPAIANWPGHIKPNTTTGQLAISLDVFPTLLELGRATKPAGLVLDGQSLVPTFSGKDTKQSRTLYWAHGNQRAMRTGDWKLVVRGKGKKNQPAAQLFDLAQDPGEQNNLASAERSRVDAMLEKLREWELEVSVTSSAIR